MSAGAPAGSEPDGSETTVSSVVVMGVSGAGKTSVARRAADALGWDYLDADDYHPPANVAKMARGEALDDADRAPWLARLRDLLAQRATEGRGTVLACSALKRAYRTTLARCDAPGGCAAELLFAWLDAPQDAVAERLAARRDHFFDPALLASQYAALEPPDPDTPPATVRLDATRPLDAVVDALLRAVRGPAM